jgi:hypothetical protein
MGRRKRKPTNDMKIILPFDIKFNMAKRVVNKHGRILHKNILDTLKLNQTVRIAMHVSKQSPHTYRVMYDTPFISIIEIKGKNILGKVLENYRTLPENYYPLRSNESVWFTSANIIEIPDLTPEEESQYGTNEYVAYTGPLETVDFDVESSESDSCDESSPSESDQDDIDVDLHKINKNAPIMRGRPNAH